MRNRFTAPSSPPIPYDPWLVLAVISLVSIGLLMVTSASIVISDWKLNQPFYYLYRQTTGLVLGILIGAIIVQFEVNSWLKISRFLLFGSILLLVLVLLPGIGHVVNGSARWVGIGPFRFQASELAKFAVVVYMAGYLFQNIKQNLTGFLKPLILLGIISLLLLKEPDFGATVVIIITALGMMFLAGMRMQHFVLLFACVLILLVVLALLEPYRVQRLTTFLNPWAYPYHRGYQLTQSLIAFGRGGWWGVGLGKSIQKLFYLPEAHTDFVFAVIVEEFGLMGALIVIFLFSFLVLRIFWIAKEAQRLHRYFASLMAYGFGLWVAIQFMVSMGVNSGMLPTKGLTLPLVSYGGNSLLMSCLMIAMILRIDYENRTILLGLRHE